MLAPAPATATPCKLQGFAVLREEDETPLRVEQDTRGKQCAEPELCATGPVHALSFARSEADATVAVYTLGDLVDPSAVAQAQPDKELTFQTVEAELEVVRLDVSADAADDCGRGESPWDQLADMPQGIVLELNPHVDGIREFRFQTGTLELIALGDPHPYNPAEHPIDIEAAARLARSRRGMAWRDGHTRRHGRKPAA